MRTVLKILGWLVGVVLVVLLGLLVYVWVALPKPEPAPELAIERTPERIERGRYLFQSVVQCANCHGIHDTTRVGEPLVRGTVGKENLRWGDALFPPNITPAALGDWTDGEILRAISSGISRDGTALFPAMPSQEYGHLSQPDLEAIVAYVRTLEPIPVEQPKGRLGFPLSLIARISAKPADPPVATPDPANSAEYGQYLAQVAGCKFCHTPFGGMPPKPDESLAYAGGHEMSRDGWIIRSQNLTPDSATGLGTWTRDRFVGRFLAARVHADSVPRPKNPAIAPTLMPWANVSNMTEQDIGAIYDFLRTLEPVRRDIVRAERAPVE